MAETKYKPLDKDSQNWLWVLTGITNPGFMSGMFPDGTIQVFGRTAAARDLSKMVVSDITVPIVFMIGEGDPHSSLEEGETLLKGARWSARVKLDTENDTKLWRVILFEKR